MCCIGEVQVYAEPWYKNGFPITSSLFPRHLLCGWSWWNSELGHYSFCRNHGKRVRANNIVQLNREDSHILKYILSPKYHKHQLTLFECTPWDRARGSMFPPSPAGALYRARSQGGPRVWGPRVGKKLPLVCRLWSLPGNFRHSNRLNVLDIYAFLYDGCH